jgi:hypothetical protein
MVHLQISDGVLQIKRCAMNLANPLTVGIASPTALALALPNLKAQSPQPQSTVARK